MSSNDVEHTDGAEVAAAEAGIISPVMRTTTGMWGSDSGPSDTSGYGGTVQEFSLPEWFSSTAAPWWFAAAYCVVAVIAVSFVRTTGAESHEVAEEAVLVGAEEY